MANKKILKSDKTGQNKTLTPQQKKGVSALLTCRTQIEAAAQVGVTVKTMARWMLLDEFQAELKNAEAEALESITRRLVDLADDAVCTVKGILSNDELPASVRLRAAESVLNNMMKLRDACSLEERIKKLEDIANERK